MHTVACSRSPCPRTTCRRSIPERRLLCAAAPASAAAPADSANPPPPPPPPSVGIDLGTSNSAIAVVGPDGRPSLIPLPDTVILAADGSATLEPGPSSHPRATLPSVVAYRPDGSRSVGGSARRGCAADPANTIVAAKRLLGRTRGEVEKQQQQQQAGGKKGGRRPPPAWPLAPGGAGDPAALAPPALPASSTLSPEDVSADVLRALLAAAAAADPAGRTPTRAVVSVPAYFSAAARAATLRAAAAAGLTTVRLVREPVAAAIGYGVRAGADRDETVLCLDLGGGTFDVCLLECGGGGPASPFNLVEVLATGGDPALGGVDWDDAVAAWLGSEHLAPAGCADWASQPGTVAGLRTLAEAAKVALSDQDAVVLTLPAGGGGAGGARPLSVTLTRARLDELAAPLYSQAARAVDAACYQAGVELGATVDAFRTRERAREAERAAKAAAVAEADQPPTKPRRRKAAAAPSLRPKERPPVSRVLLVGAPTRSPGFRAFVRNLTGLEPEEGEGGVDPDAAVALGAAVQAAALDAGAAPETTQAAKKKKGRDLVVLDVLQGALARALAAKALEEDEGLADKVMERVDGAKGGGGCGRRKAK